IEPEGRQLREHAPLVRDPRAEHVVEGRDAIRRHDEERVSEIVDVADLAGAEPGDVGQIGGSDRLKGRHGYSGGSARPMVADARRRCTPPALFPAPDPAYS